LCGFVFANGASGDRCISVATHPVYDREARAWVRPPPASIHLQPCQPLPGIINFGLAGVGVFPEVEVAFDRDY